MIGAQTARADLAVASRCWLALLTSLIDANTQTFRPEFRQYLRENLHVFDEFCTRSRALWDSGRRAYGARTIVESMRYHSDISETGSTWKLNNHFIPDMARLFVLLNPACEGLFQFRGSERRVRLES